MKSWNRKIGWMLEYSFLTSLYALSRLLSDTQRNRLGRALGRFVFKRIGYRRSVVLQQLAWALPESGPLDRWSLSVRIYEQLGVSLLEFMTLGDTSPQALLRKVDFEGLEHLEAARTAGRGAIMMTAHFGNFELCGAAVAAAGYPVNTLVRTQSNPYVDRLQNKIRRRAGYEPIKADASVRHLVRALRSNSFVAILPDVNAGDDGVFVDFMGRQASSPRGMGYFAWKMQVPIIPIFIVRQADDRHKVYVTQPIPPVAGDDEETAVRDLTQVVMDRLETFVRRYPDHWLWLHRRWKTRPPGENQA